jgi:NADH-quinone oxidoreductase subunit N
VIDVFLTDRTRWLTYVLSLLTLAGAAYMTVRYGVQARVTAFDGMYIADPMGDVLKLFSYGTVAVSFLYSREYLQRPRAVQGRVLHSRAGCAARRDGDGLRR